MRLVSNGTVRIEINGVPLVTHCGESVRHLGRKAWKKATSYLDVDLSGTDLRSHFYGNSDHTWAPMDEDDEYGPEQPMLLRCACGIDSCSPVTATITVTEDTVTWSDFTAGVSWGSSLVGPFVFGRRQYDEAIDAAKLPGLSKTGKLRS